MRRVIGLAEALQQGTPKPTGLSGTEASCTGQEGSNYWKHSKQHQLPGNPQGLVEPGEEGGVRLPEEKKNSLSFYAL